MFDGETVGYMVCIYIYRQVVVVNKLIPGGHHLGCCRFVSIGKELVE